MTLKHCQLPLGSLRAELWGPWFPIAQLLLKQQGRVRYPSRVSEVLELAPETVGLPIRTQSSLPKNDWHSLFHKEVFVNERNVFSPPLVRCCSEASLEKVKHKKNRSLLPFHEVLPASDHGPLQRCCAKDSPTQHTNEMSQKKTQFRANCQDEHVLRTRPRVHSMQPINAAD